MQRRTYTPESASRRFVGPEHEGHFETGRSARRGVAVLHMAEITEEDIEETLIFSESAYVSAGPLATGRYIR